MTEIFISEYMNGYHFKHLSKALGAKPYVEKLKVIFPLK